MNLFRKLINKLHFYYKMYAWKERVLRSLDTEVEKTDEVQKLMEQMKAQRWLSIFYGPFVKEYGLSRREKIAIHRDSENGLLYVEDEINGKIRRMYFPENFSVARAQKMKNSLEKEQDPRSPHSYFVNLPAEYQPRTVLDLGAAEGYFAMRFADTAEKIYLFETNEEKWRKPLEKTFEPWKEKTTIVHKFVSDQDEGDCVSLDRFLPEGTTVDLIKMDIEGAEQAALRGAKRVLEENPQARLLICAYHSKMAEAEIREILKEYQIQHTNGYMLFLWDEALDAPYIRRGILQATQNTH